MPAHLFQVRSAQAVAFGLVALVCSSLVATASPATPFHSTWRHVQLQPDAAGARAVGVTADPTSNVAGEPAHVSGTVLDPAGGVVEGAQVVLRGPAGAVATATSDSGGRFTLAPVAPGTYTLHVSSPGLFTEPRPLSIDAGEHRDLSVTLSLAAISDTVVVSASQVEAPATAAAAAITTFGATELDARQIDSIGDALRLTPGFATSRSGTGGALTSVFPRGGESDFTLVLIDGVRLNTFGGGFDFASLGTADVERIEVVRGPQSATFGADAIGGVVQVITRNGPPTRASALFEAGSYGTGRGAATAAGGYGAVSWGLTAEHWRSDGFNGAAPGTGDQVTNDDGRRTGGTASLRVARPTWHLAAHARSSDGERGYPGAYGSDPNNTYDGIDRVSRGWTDQQSVALQGALARGSRYRLRGHASWARLESRFRSPFDLSDAETRRLDARLQLDTALSGRWGLTAGGEHLAERAQSTYITDGARMVPVRRSVDGLFSEARFELPNRITASAGLRLERIVRHALDGSADKFAPRQPLAADTILSWNPRAAVSWLVRDASSGAFTWTRVRANAGTGIRPPDAFEIAFTDNASLAPERSHSADVALEQTFLDARVAVETSLFWNEYDDLIVAVGQSFQDASRFRTDNIANARARGIEISVTARPSAAWDLRAGYTGLDAEVLAVDGRSGEAPPPFAPGDALIRRPRHQGWVDVVFQQARWAAFARLGARGRVLDVDPTYGAFGGKLTAPGYAVLDAGASILVLEHLTVFGRVTNVADRSYEEAFGFPSPGRAFAIGARLATRR